MRLTRGVTPLGYSFIEREFQTLDSHLNEYEKAFVEHIDRLGLGGPNFARLTREALESEFGGEAQVLLGGMSQGTLDDPGLFASELFKSYGMDALRYYVVIVKYADSGKFNPEEEAEEEQEEEELESIFKETVSASDQEADARPTG